MVEICSCMRAFNNRVEDLHRLKRLLLGLAETPLSKSVVLEMMKEPLSAMVVTERGCASFPKAKMRLENAIKVVEDSSEPLTIPTLAIIEVVESISELKYGKCIPRV